MLDAAENRNKLIQEQNVTGIRMDELQEEKTKITLFSVRKYALSDEYLALKKCWRLKNLETKLKKHRVSMTKLTFDVEYLLHLCAPWLFQRWVIRSSYRLWCAEESLHSLIRQTRFANKEVGISSGFVSDTSMSSSRFWRPWFEKRLYGTKSTSCDIFLSQFSSSTIMLCKIILVVIISLTLTFDHDCAVFYCLEAPRVSGIVFINAGE